MSTSAPSGTFRNNGRSDNFLLKAMNPIATIPQNSKIIVIPEGLVGSHTFGVLAIISPKYDKIKTANKNGNARYIRISHQRPIQMSLSPVLMKSSRNAETPTPRYPRKPGAASPAATWALHLWNPYFQIVYAMNSPLNIKPYPQMWSCTSKNCGKAVPSSAIVIHNNAEGRPKMNIAMDVKRTDFWRS